MKEVSAWMVHATREPPVLLLQNMHAWWQTNAAASPADLITPPAHGACIWRTGPLHTLMVAHVDRAAHKRRRLVTYVSRETCDATHGHGLTPMSSMIAGDPYGPEELRVEHSAPESALVHAYRTAATQPYALTVTAMTEAEFSDPEFYHKHSSRQHDPLKGGVVLPFLCVPFADNTAEENVATQDREDLLRAHGYSSYTLDVDLSSLTMDDHYDIAALIEDVCDDIAGIKADAAARVLSSDPLWPMVVLRTSHSWEYARAHMPSARFAHGGAGA
ncbi:MAG: hypothetical protein WDZ57_04515 [Demequina sp.]